MRTWTLAPFLAVSAAACSAQQSGAPGAAQPEPAWRAQERDLLRDPVQITFPDRYAKAGEAYFSPDGRWIIFQAIPRPAEGQSPSPHYAMFVARLRADATGKPIAIEDPIRVSREGAANTCGYFHPRTPWRIIFGSTITLPAEDQPAGYQRSTSRYRWQFPAEMEVVTRIVPEVFQDARSRGLADDRDDWAEEDLEAAPLFARPGYDAECAFSPDGRHIVYSHVDPQTKDADLFVFDTLKNVHLPLITAQGYDGGPFFSPDGALVCFRSDRAGNDLLQVYIAVLTFADDGSITGTRAERAVTSNEHVNWAPFWDISGEFLVYSTSEMGHDNYEVFASEVPVGASSEKKPGDLRRKRITHAPGFDGLPAFSNYGRYFMWTSQRGPKLPDEQRPSSQIWIARTGDIAP